MTKQKRQKLQKDFPIFYGSLRYGFECGDGWLPLLRDLASKVEPILEKEDVTPLSEKTITISGTEEEMGARLVVKEKWGRLTIQHPGQFDISEEALDKVKKYIQEAEEKSVETCEICGSTDEVEARRYNPICQECADNERHLANNRG